MLVKGIGQELGEIRRRKILLAEDRPGLAEELEQA